MKFIFYILIVLIFYGCQPKDDLDFFNVKEDKRPITNTSPSLSKETVKIKKVEETISMDPKKEALNNLYKHFKRKRFYSNISIKFKPLHDKIVILSLYSSSTETLDSTGTIYKIYTQYCKKLSIDFLTQRSVSSIINELSLLGIISSTVISEGRYGRTKKIKKEIDYNIIKNIFSNDDTIQNLL